MTEYTSQSEHPLSCATTPDIRLVICDSIRLVKEADWDGLLTDDDVYLSRDYLQALEDGMRESIEFRYVIYYCEQYEPIGLAYFQSVDLIDNGSKYREAVKSLGGVIGQRIVKEMKLRTLVCGNVFHCGEHGYRFSDTLTEQQALDTVQVTISRLKKGNRFDKKVGIVLFKEFYPESFTVSDSLLKKKYHRFPMDVNMVMDIAPHWKTTDDYLGDLTSKARTRYKSIVKKSRALEIRRLDAKGIDDILPEMDTLFEQVLVNSPFIFGRLRMAVYADWKRRLGDRLIFHAFYLEGRLVGFNSAFVMGEMLDVHYVGMDYSINKEHMLYQRMLVDIIEESISRGLKQIHFGRTAEQAKSSFGARPVSMMLYTKHRNSIANRLIGPLMSSVKETEFDLRSPFKKD